MEEEIINLYTKHMVEFMENEKELGSDAFIAPMCALGDLICKHVERVEATNDKH